MPDCSSGKCVFDVAVRLTAGELGKWIGGYSHQSWIVDNTDAIHDVLTMYHQVTLKSRDATV